MALKNYGLSAEKLAALEAREAPRFAERTKKSAALLQRAKKVMPLGVPMAWMAGLYAHQPLFITKGQGASFDDVDGNRYLDMNQADLAGTLGFSPPAVMAAVKRRAEEGTAFLLPDEDALRAAELLADRTGVPFWQFAGSASQANNEVIRIARVATGKNKIILFGGKYHGHIDDTLVDEGAEAHAGLLGLAPGAKQGARVIPFNDLDALKRALASGDVALVLAEPMLTNCNIVFPDPGFWDEAAKLTRAAGALLAMDEAHTHSFTYGGLTRAWNLKPDLMVVGKGLGSGIAFAAYGMNAALKDICERHLDGNVAVPAGLAVGGTTFANALAMAAARAALEVCLTPETYAATEAIGKKLAQGLQSLFDRHGLSWRAPQIGGRSAWVLFPDLPRNAKESYLSLDRDFIDRRRLFMANRGVWDAIWSAGPAASFQHQAADIDLYLTVAEDFLKALL